jgi:amidase
MAAGVRAGELSAAELVGDALSAAAALDPVLHFVDSLTPGSALQAAARIDGLPPDQRGGLALAGVPFLAKDGTTVASPVVGRLVNAGAVLLGTSTRPDPAAVNQAWGWNGREHTGNPWRTDRSSGGSSAGAASAVAAGVIPVATGGDSAGSLRIPAAFCGVTGLKGTHGRVPLRRGRSLAQLTVAGVIGADLADTVLATSIASGPDLRDPAALPQWPVPATAGRQLTVGFSADLGYARPDAAVAGLVAGRVQALAAAGIIRLREVAVRLTDPMEGWLPLDALDRGQVTEPEQVTRAHEVRRHNDRELAALFGDVDVLVTPTTPQTAFPAGRLRGEPACRAPLLGLQPVRPSGGDRPGRPARRPPGRAAGRRRAPPR